MTAFVENLLYLIGALGTLAVSMGVLWSSPRVISPVIHVGFLMLGGAMILVAGMQFLDLTGSIPEPSTTRAVAFVGSVLAFFGLRGVTRTMARW